MTEVDGPDVEAMIVQLEHGSILLPRSAFLEVATRTGVDSGQRDPAAEPWLRSSLVWQDLQIPVVSVIRLLNPEHEVVDEHRRFIRLLVMQAITEPERLPFYALEVRGAPHPVGVTPQNIYALDDVEDSPWAWRVKASGVTTQLLRLDLLEQRLLELGAETLAQEPV